MKSNYTYNLMRDVYNHDIGGIKIPMKQNTAIQELIEYIDWYKDSLINEGDTESAGYIQEISDHAKELLKKEEEQIKQAWVSGLNETPKGNAENYFNQTYQINQ